MKRALLSGLLLALVLTSAAVAITPPPPEPRPKGAPDPCEHPFKDDPAPSPQPVTTQTLPTAELGTVKGSGRPLRVDWIVRISLDDPALRSKVGSIVSMDISGRYGLLAVTSGGYWLSFDLRRGELTQITTVGVAPMREAPGRPGSAILKPYDQVYVQFPDQGQQARFDLGACGVAAKAEPRPITPTAPDRVLAGYRLLKVTDPDDLLPEGRLDVYEKWVLWRSESNPAESLIQQSRVRPRKRDRQFARLTAPLATLTSVMNPATGRVEMWAARESDEPGVFTLYAISAKP